MLGSVGGVLSSSQAASRTPSSAVRMYEASASGHLTQTHKLPMDPRLWTREHVTQWLERASVQYQLGSTHPERFPMNGRGLLLMSKEMFLYRVPEGGGILYEDLQFKMQKAFSEVLEQAANEALASVQQEQS